ncbi:ATP-binding protein [Streptomyces anulatus]|uniref:ATP-binding protein n=1 Tax=Streptomyces anulatus TaxID=1892 RepID=UPI00343E8BB2
MKVKEPPDQADHMDLAAHPIAPSFARRLVERTLAKWGLEELEITANLVMTGLVANAVNATGGDIPTLKNEGEIFGVPACVRAGLYRMGDAVVIEVWDASRTPPKLVDASPDDECGRGLRIVDGLAAAWGYRWLASGGKVVWARLDQPF